MKYWLLKSEPSAFGIDDFSTMKQRKTGWDGVRNYQARNFIRDDMKEGDQGFFYHSSCAVPGIAGIVTIVREAYPDKTAFERGHDHYDADSDPTNPRWFAIDVQLERKFSRVVTLDELRAHAGGKLKDMVVLKRGNRLSITPVTKSEWQFVLSLADA
ncbi:MAG TPA: EVE domain-containing protein [Steroidobacteraceae bacterium]|nr:EVE domain-containing protein [Steroidobacteraceae bacterium]